MAPCHLSHTGLDKRLAASQGPAFYVVSKRKLALLQGQAPEASRFGGTISPAPRAAFSTFFTHALFRKVKAHGHAQPAVARWRCKLHAAILVALMDHGAGFHTLIPPWPVFMS